MGKIGELRKKFLKRSRKKGKVGLALTGFGKAWKIKKHK